MRFDWVVEIDPFDPAAMPVKRTALGRFTHEGAQVAVAPDGRVVVYMGDDDDFEHLYRFVTRDPWNPGDRAANRDLLDNGTLSVARFDSDGTMTWLPLVQGEGPLTPENGFRSQADVVLRTRAAADLARRDADGCAGRLHPAPGDRQDLCGDDRERGSPAAGRGRCGRADQRRKPACAQSRRASSRAGRRPALPIGPTTPRTTFTWDVFVLCGDPKDPASGAKYHSGTSENGWFTDPDNMGVDPAGRLWVCTDGPPDAGFNDALYVMATEGSDRACRGSSISPPLGAEVCSPTFTPDGRTMFISIQHPGGLRLDGEDATSIANVETSWPDFTDGGPPRPSLVVITRDDGGPGRRAEEFSGGDPSASGRNSSITLSAS